MSSARTVVGAVGFCLVIIAVSGCGDTGVGDRSRGEKPLQRGESRDVSDVRVLAGFRSGAFLGPRVRLDFVNRHETHELHYANVDCLLMLKNGASADHFSWSFSFDHPVPNGSQAKKSVIFGQLEYHDDDYAYADCQIKSGLLKAPPARHAFLEITDTSCDIPFLLGRTTARIQIRNSSNSLVSSLRLRCWNDDDEEWQLVRGLRREGAPLKELLPPNSIEWLIMEPPCASGHRHERSFDGQRACRIDKVQTE